MSKFEKYFLLAAGVALVAASTLIPSVHAHNGACSVASLKGTYAYLRSGSVLGQGPRDEMGISLFDGDGKSGILRFTGNSYTVSFDWTDQPWPNTSYTVDSDCTGSIFDAKGTKANNIIVLDGGKRFWSIAAGPDGQGKVITLEATRLEEKEKD